MLNFCHFEMLPISLANFQGALRLEMYSRVNSSRKKHLSIVPTIGNIKIDKDEIKRVNKTKYLGLTIEESLSWNQQNKIVKGKLKGGLKSIRKLREILPQ